MIDPMAPLGYGGQAPGAPGGPPAAPGNPPDAYPRSPAYASGPTYPQGPPYPQAQPYPQGPPYPQAQPYPRGLAVPYSQPYPRGTEVAPPGTDARAASPTGTYPTHPGQLPGRSARRRPRSDPGGLVAGLVIAGIGLFFLAAQLEPDIGRFVVLFIGLALLAVFVLRREYGFLVPGSILTGVGIGVALSPAASGVTQSGVMMLSLAGGFLAIWVLGALYRIPQNHWWPLIPGGILTLIGLVQLSQSDVDGSLRLWPIVLIVVGAIVLARTARRRT